MRPARIGTALAVCAAAALAQEPVQTLHLPTFSESVEVRVLNLDVDVTDAKGAPVPDLKLDDFTVKIGGKVVPIDYFARVDQGSLHAPDMSKASPDQMIATYKQGEETYVPRNFLIYIDLGYLPPSQRHLSINALSDLILKLGPNDAVRVVLFNRSPKVLVDWTTSKEAAIGAITSVEREGVGMSRLQSQTQTVAMIDSSGQSRRNASSRMALARNYASETGAEIQTMIGSMQQELVTLTPLNGKKSFLFLTGGFEYQPGFVMAQYAAGNQPTLANLNVRDISQYLNTLVQKANSDQITFYTVDATGLTAEGTPASEGSPAINGIVLENRPSLSFQARQDRQAGLQIMAGDTGGVALLNTNDFQKGLSRIYQDVSTYYTLGMTLSKLTITGYQDVKVTVNRPGVTVRARKGFEPLSEVQRVSNRALATMETDLSYNAIPTRIETAAATQEKKGYLLPITVLVRASALTFVPDGDKETAKAEFYIGAVDDKGGRSDLSRQESTFQVPAGKASGDAVLKYTAQLQTKKGNYRIVVNVRDSVSGKMGTARANVRVE